MVTRSFFLRSIKFQNYFSSEAKMVISLNTHLSIYFDILCMWFGYYEWFISIFNETDTGFLSFYFNKHYSNMESCTRISFDAQMWFLFVRIFECTAHMCSQILNCSDFILKLFGMRMCLADQIKSVWSASRTQIAFNIYMRQRDHKYVMYVHTTWSLNG